MRTLCYYYQDKKGWISPSALWQALRSGEELAILAPELAYTDRMWHAYDAAAEELKQKWLFDAKNSLISAFWCACIILVLFWPPLAAKMPEIVQKVLLGLFGTGILVEMVSIIALRRKKRLLASGKTKIRAATRKTAKMFPPPAFYRSEANFPKKSPKIALFCLFALLVLNLTVLAFPGRSAVVFPPNGDPYTAKLPHLVIPGTKWEWRQEYYIESAIALLAVAPDEKTVWVVDIAYGAQYIDMLGEPGPWRSWAARRLSWLLGQLSDNVWQSFPPEMERGERVALLVEVFDDAEIRNILSQAFADHFNEHHKGIVRLSVIRLEIIEIPLKDYISISRSQNEE